MTHKFSGFRLVFVSVVFRFESRVQLQRVFPHFTAFGEVHHALFEIRKRDVFEKSLLLRLSDKEVLGFECVH